MAERKFRTQFAPAADFGPRGQRPRRCSDEEVIDAILLAKPKIEARGDTICMRSLRAEGVLGGTARIARILRGPLLRGGDARPEPPKPTVVKSRKHTLCSQSGAKPIAKRTVEMGFTERMKKEHFAAWRRIQGSSRKEVSDAGVEPQVG